MRTRVLYFHSLRDVTGCAAEEIETPANATVADLLDLLEALHPRLLALRPSLLVAQGLEYATESTPLRDGEEIAVMPPVSGG
jgi:molybdopterin converting factor subunit 1